MTPELDIKAVGAEIRERIVEELDYELEASNQRDDGAPLREHPFIVVPGVVTSLCRERVIVTELVDGDGFEAMRAEPDAERDRIGEIVFRFYFGSMYRHRRFSGDPHPGNMIRLADGTDRLPRLRPVQDDRPRRSPSSSWPASARWSRTTRPSSTGC